MGWTLRYGCGCLGTMLEKTYPWQLWLTLLLFFSVIKSQKIAIPTFEDLKSNYPGYLHHGGLYRNHELLRVIGIKGSNNLLLHDTSAIRLSYTLNKIDGVHSLGKQLIRLSKFGKDSISGWDELQYIYLPIAFGPYLADKYGYPNISKLHETDPIETKHTFWGKQGILRVITYTKRGNQPKGHVALWNCNHFHQSKDMIAGNNLLTVEFWESPGSNCTGVSKPQVTSSIVKPTQSLLMSRLQGQSLSARTKYLKNHLLPKHARHSAHKLRDRGS